MNISQPSYDAFLRGRFVPVVTLTSFSAERHATVFDETFFRSSRFPWGQSQPCYASCRLVLFPQESDDLIFLFDL